MKVKSLFALLIAAAIMVSPAIAATTNPRVLAGFYHVPAYTSHIVDIDIQNKADAPNGGSYVIKTTDSVQVVSAWYKRHLPDQTSDTVTQDGHHLFYTKSGSTVDISKAVPFEGNYTIIGVVTAK